MISTLMLEQPYIIILIFPFVFMCLVNISTGASLMSSMEFLVVLMMRLILGIQHFWFLM